MTIDLTQSCPAVPMLTDVQRRFRSGLSERPAAETIDWLRLERRNTPDSSFQIETVFQVPPESGEFVFYPENEPEKRRTAAVTDHRAVVRNLLVGTLYRWECSGLTGRFQTEDVTPRFITVGGLSNVRDIGGWRTADGRRVRQGLIFRGCEFDTHHTITPDGIRTLREELGVSTELDLRGEAVGRVTESPLGSDVAFRLIPAQPYDNFLAPENADSARRMLDVLCDADSYPVYFHCWGGADRTGTLAFIIGAALGVPDEELFADYELTSLSVWGDRSRKSELFTGFLEKLRSFGMDGDSYGICVENFLCGIGRGQAIEALRANLLELG